MHKWEHVRADKTSERQTCTRSNAIATPASPHSLSSPPTAAAESSSSARWYSRPSERALCALRRMPLSLLGRMRLGFRRCKWQCESIPASPPPSILGFGSMALVSTHAIGRQVRRINAQLLQNRKCAAALTQNHQTIRCSAISAAITKPIG